MQHFLQKTFIPIIFCFYLVGCGLTFSEKEAESLGRGSYAVVESIEKSRIDLAYDYSKYVASYFPAPKKPIKIDAFVTEKVDESDPKKKNKTRWLVIPKGLENKNIVVVESDYYKQLLEENPRLKKQIDNEIKIKNQYEKEIEQLKRDQYEEQKRIKSLERRSFWGSLLGFFGISIPILIIIGLVVIAVFFPALLPVVLAIFKKIFEILVRIVKNIISSVNEIIKWFQRNN